MEISPNKRNEKNRDFSYKKNSYCKMNKIFKEKYDNNSNKNNKRPISYFKRKNNFIYKKRLEFLKKGRKCITFTQSNSEEKGKPIEYIEVGNLGSGSYGQCFIYESTQDSNLYAAKLINKEKLKRNKAKQSIISEINIQKSLNHPKIVKIKNCWEDTENIYIIQELCEYKSLADLLYNRGHLSEIEVQTYMFQLIQGLKYLHDRNIIHRDLKTNNLFLGDRLELKIGDFGLIAKLEKSTDRRTSCCGTPLYMAPEVIKPGEKGYSFGADIWSMGVIMYKLLTGKYPFYDDNQIGIYNKILNADFIFPEKPYISDVAKDLIKQILVKNPKKRPGLNQILYHDFFHKNKFPKYLDFKFYTQQSGLEEKTKNMSNKENNLIIQREVKYKELYKLIVTDIPEVKYEDINKYVLNDSNIINKIENWITYIHESRFGFCYYQVNNGLAGIIYKNEEDDSYNGLHLIYNSDTNIIYEIINEDKIKSYEIEKIPENLKRQCDDFITYHNKTKQKKNEILNNKNKIEIYENDDTNLSIISKETLSHTEDNSISSNNIFDDISINNLNETEKEKKLVYIKNYINDKKVKLLILSDDTKHAIFNDKIQILISEKIEIQMIGYMDKNKKKTFLSLVNIMKNSNKDLVKRLKYIKYLSFQNLKEKVEKKYEKGTNESTNEIKDK